jgi:hypothetical protein
MSPNAGGVASSQPMSTAVCMYTGAQINFGDLTPYLTLSREALGPIGPSIFKGQQLKV